LNILKTFPDCESFDSEIFSKLTDKVKARKYKKGEILYFEGEDLCHLFILTEGMLKLYKVSDQDKEIILHYLTPVSLIAEVEMLHRIPYQNTAVFLEDGEVLEIDCDTFETHFFGDEELTKALIFSISKKNRLLEASIEWGQCMDASSRMLTLIEESPEIFATLPKYEIANSLNISPETLSRLLKKLQKERKIVREDERWKVVN